jgi:O-antigen/teichoic acid export membrane protein
MNDQDSKRTFFRQGGWMIVATTAGGVLMAAVHMVVTGKMDSSEYAVFSALLRIFLLMGFPAGGLQTVFAQQAAAALSESEQRQLTGAVRAVLRGTFGVWLLVVACAAFWQPEITASLKMTNLAALWMTALLGLTSLWGPITRGLLQGRQDFLRLGWLLIIDGVGRFGAIVLIIYLGGQAAGGMTGAVIGQAAALAFGAYYTRRVWMGALGEQPFAWRPWFRKVLPLTLGSGVVLFMNNTDVVFVQTLFPSEQTKFYAVGAMIGLAMVMFTSPLTAVMFPKIVQSAAKTERTDALQQALGATALVGGLAAVASTLFPELPLRILFFRKPEFWQAAPLVPWFVWGLLPLVLANVLIGNLMAREQFKAIGPLVAVGVAYGISLARLKETLPLLEPFAAFKVIVQNLGLFNTLLLAVAVGFTWRSVKKA